MRTLPPRLSRKLKATLATVQMKMDTCTLGIIPLQVAIHTPGTCYYSKYGTKPLARLLVAYIHSSSTQ